MSTELVIASLAVIAAYLKLWQNSRNARSAMEMELRSQIAKIEHRLTICEERWIELLNKER